MKKFEKIAVSAIVLSVVSILTVVAMIAMWICESRKICVVELDSFVGVIVALLAIIVTFVLGWQIFNIFELRQKIEEVNNLKSQFNKQSEKIEKLSLRTEHVMNLTWGDNEISNKNYWLATYYYIKSLKYALAMDFAANIPKIKGGLEISRKELTKTKAKLKMLSSDISEIKKIDKEIRESTAYCCMKDFYDEAYQCFIEYTIVDDDQK